MFVSLIILHSNLFKIIIRLLKLNCNQSVIHKIVGNTEAFSHLASLSIIVNLEKERILGRKQALHYYSPQTANKYL